MATPTAAGLTIVLVCLAVISGPVVARQMFPAGGSGGTSCPGGSSYKGSGYAVATNQGSSSSLLVAVVVPPAQVDQFMRVLVTARPVEMRPPLIHGVSRDALKVADASPA